MTMNTKGRMVSIVINNEFIKICEVTKGVKNITVHKEVTITTPPNSYFDGAILDIDKLSKAILITLDDNRITTANVVFSVTSTKIATKEVIIPNIKLNKIDGVIQANATEYFPVNIEEYIIQHTILEKVEEEGVQKLKVLVIAAPAKMIEQYYQLASKTSMKIQWIDYIGNSTSKALGKQIGSETSVVIQIENDSTIVNIYEDCVLQLQRTIPYGKSIIVNDLVEKENLDYAVALHKLENEQLIHEAFDEDVLTDNLRYLVSNINRVMDYYISRSGKVIEKAYIIGMATRIKGFTQLMANELHVQLINITEFKDVVYDKKSYVDESVLPSYISNIGALIAPVNFVPKVLVAEGKKKNTGKLYALIMVCSLVMAAALVVIPMIGMMSAKATRDSLQNEVDNLRDIEVVVNDYYVAKDKAADADAFAALTANNNDTLQNFIKVLEEKMPSDMKFTSMSVSSGAVTVSGTAGSKSSLAELIEQLNAQKSVADVTLASETEAKDSSGIVIVTFSMTCTFSNVEAE